VPASGRRLRRNLAIRWPAAVEGQGHVTLRAAELAMLLDGIDWQTARRSRRYHRPATG